MDNVDFYLKELSLIDKVQKNFVCKHFKESYEVLGINVNNEMK